MKSYNNELISVIQDCSNWDSEPKALKEAFDRGIDFQKRKEKERVANKA